MHYSLLGLSCIVPHRKDMTDCWKEINTLGAATNRPTSRAVAKRRVRAPSLRCSSAVSVVAKSCSCVFCSSLPAIMGGETTSFLLCVWIETALQGKCTYIMESQPKRRETMRATKSHTLRFPTRLGNYETLCKKTRPKASRLVSLLLERRSGFISFCLVLLVS